MQIESGTEFVETHLSSQKGLKSGQLIRALTPQVKGVQKFVVDRLDDLLQSCQPANALTDLMRYHQIEMALFSPLLTWSLFSKAFVSHIGTLSTQSLAQQTRRSRLSQGKRHCNRVLIMSAGRTKAKTVNDANGIDTQQQLQAFLPPDAIAPLNIGLSYHPAQTMSLGITREGDCPIEDFPSILLCLHSLHQMQSKSGYGFAKASHPAFELHPIGQAGKCAMQMLLRLLIISSLTWKSDPLPKERQCNYLAILQRGGSPDPSFALIQVPQAIIADNCQCGQEGIQVHHQLAPFLWSGLNKLTLRSGFPFFNSFLFHTKRLSYNCRNDHLRPVNYSINTQFTDLNYNRL